MVTEIAYSLHTLNGTGDEQWQSLLENKQIVNYKLAI